MTRKPTNPAVTDVVDAAFGGRAGLRTGSGNDGAPFEAMGRTMSGSGSCSTRSASRSSRRTTPSLKAKTKKAAAKKKRA